MAFTVTAISNIQKADKLTFRNKFDLNWYPEICSAHKFNNGTVITIYQGDCNTRFIAEMYVKWIVFIMKIDLIKFN